jgi:peptidoglycan/LPS O-acetylase OafA/YrhL
MRGKLNRTARSGEAATARRARKILPALIFALALGVPSAVASVTDIPVRVTPARDVHPVAGVGFLAWVQNTRAHPDLFNV